MALNAQKHRGNSPLFQSITHSVCRIIALMLSLMIILASNMTFAGEADVQRLRQEYSGALATLSEAYSKVFATVSMGAPNSGFEREFYTCNGFEKAIVRTKIEGNAVDPEMYEVVYCVGPEASFAMHRNLSEKSSYILDDVGYEDVRDKYNNIAGKYLYASFKFNGWASMNYSDESAFQILSATTKIDGDDEVLMFEYQKVATDENPNPTRGFVEVLPRRAWAFRHHEVRGTARASDASGASFDKSYTIVLDVKYDGDRDGIPIPKSVTYTYPNNKYEGCVFDSIEFGIDTPEREFTPAFYQMPNITKIARDPARSTSIYWLFGIAVLTLVAAVIIKKRSSS